jgi:uncharacterized RDD family membrane protein YckC
MFTRRNSVVEMPADGLVTMGGGALAYGGFWARFAALIIDNAILTIVAVMLIVLASLVDESLAALASLAYLLAALLYWPLMESSSLQATLGKQLLGMQVTDGAGERLSFVRSLLRNIAKIISAIPLYIGFLLAAFTSRKQALHDIITNCVVVRSGPSNFLKAAGATVAALIITAAGGYFYISSVYNVEMEKAEKAAKAAQKPKPAPKPLVEQVQAPGQAFPAGKPAPAPAAAEPAPVKPAAAPAPPEPAPKVAAAAPVKEPAPPAKPAAASEPAPVKPMAAPAPAKPATAEVKPTPAPAKPATAEIKPMPAQPAAPAPVKAAAAPVAKAKPAPKPEPVTTAAAPADEAPKTPRQAPAPRPAPPPVEVTRVPAAAAGPTPTYNDIMTAVMYRDRTGVAQLLDLGWWPDRPDSNGVTPLMAAAMNGDAAITELLLSRGADPLRRGPGGSTLNYANRGGSIQVVDLLRKAGAR